MAYNSAAVNTNNRTATVDLIVFSSISTNSGIVLCNNNSAIDRQFGSIALCCGCVFLGNHISAVYCYRRVLGFATSLNIAHSRNAQVSSRRYYSVLYYNTASVSSNNCSTVIVSTVYSSGTVIGNTIVAVYSRSFFSRRVKYCKLSLYNNDIKCRRCGTVVNVVRDIETMQIKYYTLVAWNSYSFCRCYICPKRYSISVLGVGNS